ncbi:PLP-dependent aminotransferase family protein [Sinomicrobium weinanense]|uniref:PLP-dependent aminotransferase family protein n=1 Tax=Sinomicrobium weinanense TaxID=2842200 RepID=A0A926JSI1_9FLAO|nr:PLP-dependent aminotransferase family protein [Sinomicrobium weinanense]MBC9796564.1 PLP-dependent aminotransferase family protein [Sinomicrobium weinanense]MBU3123049.1 PLP-dependent aminotransferase family protein [Sinomicrobium weinanense]
MLPYKTVIKLDKKACTPLYIQLCNQVIQLIKCGVLAPSTKLPGTRWMADTLQVHRKTVIAAYDELMAQDWIEVRPAKGTFVNGSLPLVEQQPISGTGLAEKARQKAGFSFIQRKHLNSRDTEFPRKGILGLDDGVPDNRIAPIEEIARVYRNIVKKSYNRRHLSYGSIYGNMELREALADYLNDTRGLSTSPDNILITRGSQMGIYLSARLLLAQGENIVVGETNYRSANKVFIETGGRLNRVRVDENGMVTSDVEALCKKKKIRAVYVTSHHHHPTTVTLSAPRRMHLLELSQKYHFAIVEDDYDYDFHYCNAPILPLASGDSGGNVIYIGALCKIVAPAIRVGYLVAPKDFVDEAARLRRVIDRQGDQILELTLARMIRDGEIQRHSKKALKIYHARRDLFCTLLRERLGKYFEFRKPEGGMAIWVTLREGYDWEEIKAEAKKNKLKLGGYCGDEDDTIDQPYPGLRMGFASLTPDEIKEAVNRLETTMKFLEQKVESYV